MSRHIAGGRLRRFYIHSHIYGDPRAAKTLPSKGYLIARTVYRMSVRQRNLSRESLTRIK